MIEQTMDINTADGQMETFLCHPERGGPYPAVCFLMDAHGLREELRDMARRLATVGYYVLLPNLYYRAGQDTIFGPGMMEEGCPEHARMRAVRVTMTIPPVMRDIAAMLAFIDRQDLVMPGPVGCHGYCMSSPYALAAAARYPDRIAAAASFYGTWLVYEWTPLGIRRASWPTTNGMRGVKPFALSTDERDLKTIPITYARFTRCPEEEKE